MSKTYGDTAQSPRRNCKSRTLLALIAAPLIGLNFGFAQQAKTDGILAATREALQKMVGDTIVNGQAYVYDQYLADDIGPRLTGSAQYMRAADWALRQFQWLGLVNVHLENWIMPAIWEPEVPATGRILVPVEHHLHIYSVGWGPSTPAQGVEGQVVYVPSSDIADLDKQKSQLLGAIALIDDLSFGAAHTVDKTIPAIDHLRALGVKAIIEPGDTNGTENSDTMMNFTGTINGIPEAQLGKEDVLLTKRLLERGPVTMQFSFTNHVRSHVQVPNIVAEIKGSQLPDEPVIVAAHLDSWDPGTGAQDDGTGVAMVMEAARAMMNVHKPPSRTVRFVLLGGEEEGLLGSIAYSTQHTAELPKIDAVLISDSGSESARGWCL
jgi:carboxypeptidase Q